MPTGDTPAAPNSAHPSRRTVGGPGDVAEPARAGEQEPRGAGRVDVDQLQLAAAGLADDDREPVAAGLERRLLDRRAERADRAHDLPGAVEDEQAAWGGD